MPQDGAPCLARGDPRSLQFGYHRYCPLRPDGHSETAVYCRTDALATVHVVGRRDRSRFEAIPPGERFMREVNLHRFEDVLTSTFRRYLFTKNLVADNQPELRNAFWSQLQSRDFFTREPMVSAIPAYETSLCIRELVGRSSPPNLHRRLLDVNTSEIDLDRKLYQHQVESIGKAQLGRNIIVATGTGSGKTECFL